MATAFTKKENRNALIFAIFVIAVMFVWVIFFAHPAPESQQTTSALVTSKVVAQSQNDSFIQMVWSALLVVVYLFIEYVWPVIKWLCIIWFVVQMFDWIITVIVKRVRDVWHEKD